MTKARFTPAAIRDLDGIFDYSANRWGQRRAVDYTLAIRDACERLAKGDAKGRRVEARVELCRYAVSSHVVFFCISPDRLDIIRILHVRQDPESHLDE